MTLFGSQLITMRRRGLLNAAAVGVLASGLLVLIPRAVVALSVSVEALLHLLAPTIDPKGPGTLIYLFALPTIYQLLLAIAVLYSYGAGAKGRPEEDQHARTELLGWAGALACIALSAAQHAQPGWVGVVLLVPLLFQAVALLGLVDDQRSLLGVYGPALVVFAVCTPILGGQSVAWLDLCLVPAVPILAFAIGRLLRLTRIQCGFGAHATMAVAFGFVLAYGLTKALERVVGLI